MSEFADKLARAVLMRCAWGWCFHDVDPVDRKIVSGGGLIACPCDHLPGWRSRYVEGQAKPNMPVKVKGRHGPRVQRSRKRHHLPKNYLSALVGEMLPAYPEAKNRGMLG